MGMVAELRGESIKTRTDTHYKWPELVEQTHLKGTRDGCGLLYLISGTESINAPNFRDIPLF